MEKTKSFELIKKIKKFEKEENWKRISEKEENSRREQEGIIHALNCC